MTQMPDVSAVIRFAGVLMTCVSERLLSWAAVAISAVLFGWVLYAPDKIRLIAACAYAVLVVWPIIRLDARKGGTDGNVRQAHGGSETTAA